MALWNTDRDAKKERFETLKQTVDLGIKQFRRTGTALREIRDEQLYRVTYATFELCCQTEWKITERHADRLIEAASFCDEIGPEGQPPSSEREYRALTALPKEERLEAWSDAQDHGGTPEAIAAAIAKRRPRKKKTGALKPLRLKVPGGSVVVTPNRKGKDYETMLNFALQMIAAKRDAA